MLRTLLTTVSEGNPPSETLYKRLVDYVETLRQRHQLRASVMEGLVLLFMKVPLARALGVEQRFPFRTHFSPPPPPDNEPFGAKVLVELPCLCTETLHSMCMRWGIYRRGPIVWTQAH